MASAAWERMGTEASNRQQPLGAQAARQAWPAPNPTGELCRAGPAHRESRWALASILLMFFKNYYFFFFSTGNIQLEPERQGLSLNQKQRI